MNVYKIEGVKFNISKGGTPYETQDDLNLVFSDEAENALNKFLPKYDIDIEFTNFFDNLNIDVWACICFTKEQDIAGHVANSRINMSQVALTPYEAVPRDPDKDYVPKVGVLYIQSKSACEDLSHKSDLFMMIWSHLKNYDRSKRWLFIINELPESIKQITINENKKLWQLANIS